MRFCPSSAILHTNGALKKIVFFKQKEKFSIENETFKNQPQGFGTLCDNIRDWNAELPLYFLRRFLHHKWISEMTFHWEGVLIIVWLATEVSLPQSSVFMWFAQNLVLSPSEGVYYTLCEVLCKLLIANHVRLSNAQAGADTLQPLVYIWPTACTFVFGQGHAQLFIIYCLYLFSCYNSRVAQL